MMSDNSHRPLLLLDDTEMGDINPRSAKTISRVDYDDDYDQRAMPSWTWRGKLALTLGGAVVWAGMYLLAKWFVSLLVP